MFRRTAKKLNELEKRIAALEREAQGRRLKEAMAEGAFQGATAALNHQRCRTRQSASSGSDGVDGKSITLKLDADEFGRLVTGLLTPDSSPDSQS